MRVNTLAVGTTTVPGGNQIVIVRDAASLGKLGIQAPVHYKSEFGVVLLMGPHDRTRLQADRRIDPRGPTIAFASWPSSRHPADGGEPSPEYRTYTLWIVPNRVYRRGVRVEVVTPSDEPIADDVSAVGTP